VRLPGASHVFEGLPASQGLWDYHKLYEPHLTLQESGAQEHLLPEGQMLQRIYYLIFSVLH